MGWARAEIFDPAKKLHELNWSDPNFIHKKSGLTRTDYVSGWARAKNLPRWSGQDGMVRRKKILFFYLIQPDKWSALPGTHEPSTAFMYSCLYPACYTVTRDKNVVCWYLWKWIICSTFLYSGITDTWSWTYTPVTKVNIYLFIYIISRGEPPLLFHKKSAAAM